MVQNKEHTENGEKFNPLEGIKGPEIVLQLGYSGLVGSDELSVRDMSLTIGKSILLVPILKAMPLILFLFYR